MVEKELMLKVGFSAALAGLMSYFNILLTPILMLLFVMICDYVTGFLVAWTKHALSSSIGTAIIFQKVGYFFAVCVGGGVDWLLQSALQQIGWDIQTHFTIGTMVLVWLVINEMLSILENLTTLGVPLPSFLKKIVEKLRVTVEQTAEQVVETSPVPKPVTEQLEKPESVE